MTESNLTDDGKITIELSKSEALVLFEFTSRFFDEEILKIEDQAEETALSKLCGKLESILVEPFMPNYLQLLEKAREDLRSKW
jgi:hypothetical protein